MRQSYISCNFPRIYACYPVIFCHRVRRVPAKYQGMTEIQLPDRSLGASAPPPAAGGPAPAGLTIPRGVALYIGALLGPSLLLVPGLAAAQAGPASVLTWAALLVLSGAFAFVFGALGRAYPSAGGVVGYVRAGLGAQAGTVAGWSFLAGVVAGAPLFCLVGAGYVTELTGGGRLPQALIGAAFLLTVLALAAGGLRASATAQLLLVGLLLCVVVVAVLGSAGAAHAANWTPFAPHGWQAVGRAAADLMLSFVGWEAVAPLTTRFTDPARQLPRVIGAALAATTVLYLGIAIATVSVLGTGAGTTAPFAALLRAAVGPAGTAAAAVAAAVLTLGSVNAYVTGAAEMAAELARSRRDRPGTSRSPGLLAAVTASGLALISLYGAGLASPVALVTLPAALFLVVYLGCMTSAARILRGPARWAAAPAALVVAAILAYCGWSLAAPAAVILAVGLARPLARLAGAGARRAGARRQAATAPAGGRAMRQRAADRTAEAAALTDKSADLRG
jgi:amino acid efflux transporter